VLQGPAPCCVWLDLVDRATSYTERTREGRPSSNKNFKMIVAASIHPAARRAAPRRAAPRTFRARKLSAGHRIGLRVGLCWPLVRAAPHAARCRAGGAAAVGLDQRVLGS